MRGFDHRLLREAEEVVNCIVSDHLVEADYALSLFAHGALEEVSGRLVVMRIGDNACYYSYYCEGVDL